MGRRCEAGRAEGRRVVGLRAAVFRADGLLVAVFLAAVFLVAVVRRAVVLRAAGFRRAVDFLAVVFLAVLFLAVVFRRAVDFLPVVFLPVVFLAVLFRAVAVRRAVDFRTLGRRVWRFLAAAGRFLAEVARVPARLLAVARFVGAAMCPPLDIDIASLCTITNRHRMKPPSSTQFEFEMSKGAQLAHLASEALRDVEVYWPADLPALELDQVDRRTIRECLPH